MKKNNLCLLNKVLLYEETDSFSQSNFNPNKSSYAPLKKGVNQIKKKDIDILDNKICQFHNKYDVNNNNKLSKKNHISYNKTIIVLKDLYERIMLFRRQHQQNFELNYYIFGLNNIIKKYETNDNLDKEYIEKFYSYNESILIIPKKEFYYFHHMLFLERPNYINFYFNKLAKKIGLEKLNIYQNQRKKEYKIEQLNNKNDKNEVENEKIFDTNVLETIENYSTTITQEPINEKPAILTPFEILKRCEDTKKKKNVKSKNDQKSIITFSESEISYNSKNIPDESLITVVKDLTEKPNKIDKQEKKYTNFFIKKKNIQKFTRTNKQTNNINVNNNINFNKNVKNNNNNLKLNSNNKNNKINNIYDINNEEKEMVIKKTVSTSTNKKTKKKIIIDMMYQNTISKSSSKKESFINNALSNKCEETLKTNVTSFGATRKNKGVLNLKKQSYKIKTHNTKFSDNYIKENSIINNNINNNTKSKLGSNNYNDLDKLLTFFLTPKNKNLNQNNYDKTQSKYAEFNNYNIKKRQIKKNTTLTIVNNNIINNSQNSQEKYQKISNCKSKSPLTRIFLKKNNYVSNCKSNIKKKKSVLIPEFKHSQVTKSLNKYLEKKKDGNKNISSNNINNNNKHLNIMTLGSNRRNSYQFMKLNKHITKK